VKGWDSLNREEALEIVISALGRNDITVGTTGFLSRELYEIRERKKQFHSNDFLCVG